MRTTKIIPIIFFSIILIAGCAQNRAASNENHPSSYSSAPPEQRLTPTSDRPDAQPHIYSNSTSHATSPAVSPEDQ